MYVQADHEALIYRSEQMNGDHRKTAIICHLPVGRRENANHIMLTNSTCREDPEACCPCHGKFNYDEAQDHMHTNPLSN